MGAPRSACHRDTLLAFAGGALERTGQRLRSRRVERQNRFFSHMDDCLNIKVVQRLDAASQYDASEIRTVVCR
jgi:hypothetical protein